MEKEGYSYTLIYNDKFDFGIERKEEGLHQILHVLFSKKLCFIENKLENKFILLFKEDESDELKSKRNKLNQYLDWFFLHIHDDDIVFPKESTICKENIYYKDIDLFLDCYFLDDKKRELVKEYKTIVGLRDYNLEFFKKKEPFEDIPNYSELSYIDSQKEMNDSNSKCKDDFMFFTNLLSNVGLMGCNSESFEKKELFEDISNYNKLSYIDLQKAINDSNSKYEADLTCFINLLIKLSNKKITQKEIQKFINLFIKNTKNVDVDKKNLTRSLKNFLKLYNSNIYFEGVNLNKLFTFIFKDLKKQYGDKETIIYVYDYFNYLSMQCEAYGEIKEYYPTNLYSDLVKLSETLLKKGF